MTNNTAMNNDVYKASRRSKKLAILSKVVIYLILIIYAIIIIFPFSIVLITSFKGEVQSRNPVFSIIPPEGYTWKTYYTGNGYKAIFQVPYTIRDPQTGSQTPLLLNGFINTLMYIIPPTFIGLFTSTLAAYAFAKLRFRSKNIMYGILLATMMIPGTITIAPTYTMYAILNLHKTPFPLIVPGMFGAAACVFFMRQFISGIPDSVVEAAKIDGVSFFGIFIKIIIPLSVPALIAQGLLGFIGGYNDYFGPMIYLKEYPKFTLQLTLQYIAGQSGAYPNRSMAATVIALLPTLVIYFIAQDFFIEGIAASGIKG